MPKAKDKTRSVGPQMETRSRARKRSASSEKKSKRQKLTSTSSEVDKTDLNILFVDIGKKIGKKYHDLGICLGLDDSDIQNIEISLPHDAARWGYEVINAWSQKQPDNLPLLAQALREVGRVDLSRKVDTFIEDHPSLRPEEDADLPQRKIGNDEPAETSEASQGPITNITNNVVDFNKTADLEAFLEHMEKHKGFAILSGMSGIGKTEIAKFYWHENENKFDVGWNISSDTDKNLKIAASEFVEKLASIEIKVGYTKDEPLPSLLQKIRSEICNIQRASKFRGGKLGKYLLIFDDAGDETKNTIAESFNPNPSTTNNISVVLTTQQSISHDNNVKLDGFTKEEVLTFLRDMKDDRKSKLELWEEMSHLPSALTCAKNYIETKKRSIQNYLEGIKDKTLYKAMEKRDAKILGISYADKTPVCAHVQYAKAMIEEIRDKPICFVLKTMGYFDSKAIPEFILREILRQKHMEDKQPLNNKHIGYHIDDLLSVMQKRSYITITTENSKDDDRIVDTYKMVQLGIRHAMDEKDCQPVLEMLMRVLLRYFAKDTRYLTFFRRNTRLVKHVEIVLKHVQTMGIKEVSFNMQAMAIALYDRLGYFYTQDNFIQDAEEKLLEGVEMIYKTINIGEKDLNQEMENELKIEDGEVNIDRFAMKKANFIHDKLQKLGSYLVKHLVINRVLNVADVEVMKSQEGKELPEFLSQNATDESIYKKLVDAKLAIPESDMKAIYLTEVYASVFYSYGRMYFYKEERPENGNYISNIRLASALCKIIEMKTKSKCVVLHRILSQRNGLLYLYSEDKDEFGKEKSDEKKRLDLKEGKKKYKELLSRTNKEDWYQHGILKVTKNDSFHKCICLEKCIFICTKLLRLQLQLKDGEREEVIREGKESIGELMEIISGEESEAKAKLHKASNFYAVTAEFYEEIECWDDASRDYKQALERCKNPDFGRVDWKKYEKCCIGLMHVARHMNKEKQEEAEEIGSNFLTEAPTGSLYKEVNKLVRELQGLIK